MNPEISCCGFRCDLCQAYKKNIQEQDQTRLLSDKWYEYFGFRIPADQISCDGCLSSDTETSDLMDKACPVRPCVVKKQLPNCAYCDEFPCDKLQSRFVILEEKEKELNRPIPEADYLIAIKPYENHKRLSELRKQITLNRASNKFASK
ncbi:MAG: DUF3795 domain-containing protein [Promethearchaeota archaeon]